jgi:hypothetical protein
MTPAIQIAIQYFELSNASDLAQIEKLFGPSSTYHSSTMGVHTGADDIMQMQEAFHAKFMNLKWTIQSITEPTAGTVEIKFDFHGTTKTGTKIQNSGKEVITIHNREIAHIEIQIT